VTHQQARTIIAIAGIAMVVIGALVATLAKQDWIRPHAIKLSLAGVILVIVAMVNW
jgi:hypothetical protein